MSDFQIITEYDLKYCPAQETKNSEITPYDLPDNGQVWRIGNRRWTPAYESLYSKWIEAELNDSFLIDLDIKADCADIVFFARAVFARMNNLPFSIHTVKASNFQTKWKDLKSNTIWDIKNWKKSYAQDERFKAALTQWADSAGQYHLKQDIYPIKVLENKILTNQLRSGQVLISPGHASIVNIQRDAFLPYKLTTSKIPAEIRVVPLVVRSLGAGYSFNSWKPIINCKGKFKTVPAKMMENYSPTYDPSFEEADIVDKIQMQLRNKFNPGITREDEIFMAYNEVKQLVETLKLKVQERIEAVDLGYSKFVETSASDHFKSQGSMKFGRQSKKNKIKLEEFKNQSLDYLNIFPVKNQNSHNLYYSHSTPSRDLRLRDLMRNIFNLLPYLDDQRVQATLTSLIEYEFEYDEDKHLSIYHVFLIDILSPFSSQPWSPPKDRWLSKEYANTNFAADPLKFLEDRYYQGKKILQNEEGRKKIEQIIKNYLTNI